MTGQQIYVLASSFLYERDGEDADSKHFAVGFINILLQEALPCENSNRKYRAILKIGEAEAVLHKDDDIRHKGLDRNIKSCKGKNHQIQHWIAFNYVRTETVN